MKIAILPSASQDIVEGFNFYENQKSGLGSYFIDSLFSDIDSLIIYRGIHYFIYDRYFRMLAKRFPFAIYYSIDNDAIIVYAVLDCRRDPPWIRKRLEG